MPNHSTVVYESTMSMSNSFECLSDMNERSRSVNSSNDLSMSSIGSPTAASSPKCKQRNPVNPDLSMLRTLTINFQSIKNKVPDLHALIDSAQPHVIIGTETWLTDLDLSFMFDRHSKELDIDIVDSYTTVE
jgi:hypothetical protein